MARISYKADQELASNGLLRISLVAKLLQVAPKTVNAWTKYTITKVHGVKYLTWSEVYVDKITEALLADLPTNASSAWGRAMGIATQAALPVHSVTHADSALAKAKALLTKKIAAPATSFPKEMGMPVTMAPPEEEPILGVVPVDDDVLTIPSEYKHMLRGK